MGMREMQQKAYSANSAQYLLIKAPPASGKSRALMFIALEKLHHQGIKKVIVAVPENQSVHLLHQRSFQNMAFLQIGTQTRVITFVLRVRIKVKLQHF